MEKRREKWRNGKYKKAENEKEDGIMRKRRREKEEETEDKNRRRTKKKTIITRRKQRKRRKSKEKCRSLNWHFNPQNENCATEFSPWVKAEMDVLFLVRDSRWNHNLLPISHKHALPL